MVPEVAGSIPVSHPLPKRGTNTALLTGKGGRCEISISYLLGIGGNRLRGGVAGWRRIEDQHDIPSIAIPRTPYCVALCTDGATYKRLNQLSLAKDYDGISRLILMGQVHLVPGGTPALIVQNGVFSLEVKILSGDHEGRYGLVSINYVK